MNKILSISFNWEADTGVLLIKALERPSALITRRRIQSEDYQDLTILALATSDKQGSLVQ